MMMTVPLTAALAVLLSGLAATPRATTPQQPISTFVRVYSEQTEGLLKPVVMGAPQPIYSPDAMRAKVQGSVALEITVDADGRVRDAMVTKSLEPSLDDNAVVAISRWTFKPGRLNNVPVSVRLTTEMAFRLH